MDRTYLPDFLLPSAVSCEVLDLPGNLAVKTDHCPLATTVRGTPGARPGDSNWRVDAALLQDEACTKHLGDLLREWVGSAPPITPQAWDSLKSDWKKLLQEEGRNRKRRITARMHELLRRIHIIKGAVTLTSCTSDYLETLETQYAKLLRDKSQRPGRSHAQSSETAEVDLREVCGNGNTKISRATRPDGSSTEDPAEIAAIFRNHFKSVFQETVPCETSPEPIKVNDLCRGLRRLDEEEFVTLSGEATLEELRRADGKPAPVRRNLLQLPESEGASDSLDVLTISKVLALKTARSLYQASDYIGRGLLLYWRSTHYRETPRTNGRDPLRVLQGGGEYKTDARQGGPHLRSRCGPARTYSGSNNAKPADRGRKEESERLAEKACETGPRPP
ncbi:hypothetical protein MTO96_045289 [Rhipicephalus appendiculatus]